MASKHYKHTIASIVAIVCLVAVVAINVITFQANVIVSGPNLESPSYAIAGLAGQAPDHRFRGSDSLPVDTCWENNGCYGIKRGTAFRCDDTGYENDYGDFACSCDYDCNVVYSTY